MTRPTPPTIPPQARRSNPATFNENAEQTIAYLFDHMPTYQDAMADYLEARADDVSAAVPAAQDAVAARDAALSAQAEASNQAALADAARNQAEAFETLADAHRVEAEAARDAALSAAGDAQGVPVGAILPFAGTQMPVDFLLCDGADFDANAYPALSALLGGNRVPDLRGQFLRGLDSTGLVDPEGATRTGLLSQQGDAYAEHVHPVSYEERVLYSGDNYGTYTGPFSGHPWVSEQHATQPSGEAETRPKNIAVHFMIRAR